MKFYHKRVPTVRKEVGPVWGSFGEGEGDCEVLEYGHREQSSRVVVFVLLFTPCSLQFFGALVPKRHLSSFMSLRKRSKSVVMSYLYSTARWFCFGRFTIGQIHWGTKTLLTLNSAQGPKIKAAPVWSETKDTGSLKHIARKRGVYGSF